MPQDEHRPGIAGDRHGERLEPWRAGGGKEIKVINPMH